MILGFIQVLPGEMVGGCWSQGLGRAWQIAADLLIDVILGFIQVLLGDMVVCAQFERDL